MGGAHRAVRHSRKRRAERTSDEQRARRERATATQQWAGLGWAESQRSAAGVHLLRDPHRLVHRLDRLGDVPESEVKCGEVERGILYEPVLAPARGRPARVVKVPVQIIDGALKLASVYARKVAGHERPCTAYLRWASGAAACMRA